MRKFFPLLLCLALAAGLAAPALAAEEGAATCPDCGGAMLETERIYPTPAAEGSVTRVCLDCGKVETEIIPASVAAKTATLPVSPAYGGTFLNWLGSVAGLFDKTLNAAMGLPALRLFAGTLVFLTVFSLLAKLLRQGRKGRL